jgi:hypothetical protein
VGGLGAGGGDAPSTWGEAALMRTVEQQYSNKGKLIRNYPELNFGQTPTYMSAPRDALGKDWVKYINALKK